MAAQGKLREAEDELLAISVEQSNAKSVPSRQIPYANVAIAATADQEITPWYHGPDAHDVALEGFLMVANRVEDVNLRIVKRHHDILVGEM